MTYRNDWKFIASGLMTDKPSEFFTSLHLSGYEGIKELSDLDGVIQHPEFHPEGDAFVHVMCCIDAAANIGASLKERYAVLCHDLGKRKAFNENRAAGKQHLGKHDIWGVPFVTAMSERLGVPKEFKKFAINFAKHHTKIHILNKLEDITIFEIFDDVELSNKNLKVIDELIVCATSDARGRGPLYEKMDHPNGVLLLEKASQYLINKLT